jgi:hypothetical protein
MQHASVISVVTAKVPSSPVLVTLMMEATRSSKTSVLTRATWCNIPEDAILHIDSNQVSQPAAPKCVLTRNNSTSKMFAQDTQTHTMNALMENFRPSNWTRHIH